MNGVYPSGRSLIALALRLLVCSLRPLRHEYTDGYGVPRSLASYREVWLLLGSRPRWISVEELVEPPAVKDGIVKGVGGGKLG